MKFCKWEFWNFESWERTNERNNFGSSFRGVIDEFRRETICLEKWQSTWRWYPGWIIRLDNFSRQLRRCSLRRLGKKLEMRANALELSWVWLGSYFWTEMLEMMFIIKSYLSNLHCQWNHEFIFRNKRKDFALKRNVSMTDLFNHKKGMIKPDTGVAEFDCH